MIFSVDHEDKKYTEFKQSGWTGTINYTCSMGVDCLASGFPSALYSNLNYPRIDSSVERVIISFTLKKNYEKVVLRLARGGTETTVVKVDGENTYDVTSTMLGSSEGSQ